MGFEAKLLEYGGMYVCHVVGIFDGVKTYFVGGSVGYASLYPAARHPDAETVDMMVSSVRPL